jgi:hypothetical protein
MIIKASALWGDFMKRFIIGFSKNESGQALVLFALLAIVLIGIAALVIDAGLAYAARAKAQNAADAAALAGAQDLPSFEAAIGKAKDYAEHNGIERDDTTATAPYDGDEDKIEVICAKDVRYTLARVLGLEGTNVSARAVAKKISQWSGEALPFLNVSDKYDINKGITLWEKEGAGVFGRLEEKDDDDKDGLEFGYVIHHKNDEDRVYFEILYKDGILVAKGTVANIKTQLQHIFNQNYPEKKTVYIFSLTNKAIEEGNYKNLDNKQRIPKEDLVLLEATFDSYDEKDKKLSLTVTGIYDIYNGKYPKDYYNPDVKGIPRLIQ